MKNSKDEIYLEDLDFFETELATGNYAESYISECKEQIEIVRKWLSGDEQFDDSQSDLAESPKKKSKASLVMGIHDIAPENANPVAATMTPEEIIFSDIKSMRDSDSYKSRFKKYVQDKAEIDASFVDTHYSFFMQWELDAIVSVRQLGEEFLEKYFGALDKDKISRYQLFSESFFMKHYSQMDATIVLTKGKNEWRKKKNVQSNLMFFLD